MTALWLSLPIGLLVAAILHGNEWRDISEDTRAGHHHAVVARRPRLRALRVPGLTLGAYVVLGLAVVFLALPPHGDAGDALAAAAGRRHPRGRARRERAGAGDRDDRPRRRRGCTWPSARCWWSGVLLSRDRRDACVPATALKGLDRGPCVGLGAAQVAFAATFRGPRDRSSGSA